MPGHDNAQNQLKQCLRDARRDPVKVADCEKAFMDATGATPDGGKVFVTPDGEATSTTNGGKVFRGGKAV